MLAGNNVDDAKELFATSNVNKRIVSEDDFGKAAKLVSQTKLKDFVEMSIPSGRQIRQQTGTTTRQKL